MLYRILDGIDAELAKYIERELHLVRLYYGIRASNEADLLARAMEIESTDYPVSVWLMETAARIEQSRTSARREKERLRAEYARPFR